MGPPFFRVMGPGQRIEQPVLRLPRNGLRVHRSKSLFRTIPRSEVLQGHGATEASTAAGRSTVQPGGGPEISVGVALAIEDGVAAWWRESRAADCWRRGSG